MTRARFLLVSFFAAVGAILGFDRERMARRWLLANGFRIEEWKAKSLKNVFMATVHHPKIGISSARSLATYEQPYQRVASDYIEFLTQNGFSIVEKHVVMAWPAEATWTDVKPMIEREILPPTIHRFERPWWV